MLHQSEAYVTAEGEPLISVAAEPNLSLSVLRQFNPELSSWPSTEPLPAGTTLLLPVYCPTSPLPARRAAPPAEEGVETLGSRLAQQPKTAASMRDPTTPRFTQRYNGRNNLKQS